MIPHAYSWVGSRGLSIIGLLTLAAFGGCDASAGIIGKWSTLDRSDLMKNPATAENDLANLLSPVPNFSIKLGEDGTFVSSWKGTDGKDGSKSGTWKMLEDQGLKWRISLKMPPDEEEWEVKVGSPAGNKLSLESLDSVKKGGPIYFKRG